MIKKNGKPGKVLREKLQAEYAKLFHMSGVRQTKDHLVDLNATWEADLEREVLPEEWVELYCDFWAGYRLPKEQIAQKRELAVFATRLFVLENMEGV